MKFMKISVLGFTVMFSLAAQGNEVPELRTVASVDLNRYAGTWVEIARLPNPFQKKCGQATAKYALRADGKMDVLNSCKRLSDGSLHTVQGLAEVVDQQTRSKLRVIFTPGLIRWLGIGWGKYWIIEIDPEYRHVVVSEPTRQYLWIMSREPEMEQGVYDGILERLKANHFDVSKLISYR